MRPIGLGSPVASEESVDGMVEEAIRKAEVLIEALGYIRKFRNRIIVIKLGGSVMEHGEPLDATLEDVLFMETVGLHPILVHGGGKAITQAMTRAGIESRFVKGRRYTDEQTLEIVADVLVQSINTDIVDRINRIGGWAMGLHYRTTNCLFGERIAVEEDGQPIDLGCVGQVTRIDDERLTMLCRAGIIPVLPCLATDGEGTLLNVNADTAAAAVARLIKAEKLIFISDTPGILLDRDDESTLVRSLSAAQCRDLIGNGTIGAGMIPKVEACLESLGSGVGKTHMIDGRIRHSLLLEIYTARGIGTEIVL